VLADSFATDQVLAFPLSPAESHEWCPTPEDVDAYLDALK